MKKFLLLLMVTMLLSCSSDDENPSNFSVLGSWQLENSNPPIPGMDLEACPDKPQITFESNGEAVWIVDSEENSCQGEAAPASWEQISATEYSITLPELGTFVGTVEFIGEDRFTFSTHYQTFPVVLTFTSLSEE